MIAETLRQHMNGLEYHSRFSFFCRAVVRELINERKQTEDVIEGDILNELLLGPAKSAKKWFDNGHISEYINGKRRLPIQGRTMTANNESVEKVDLNALSTRFGTFIPLEKTSYAASLTRCALDCIYNREERGRNSLLDSWDGQGEARPEPGWELHYVAAAFRWACGFEISPRHDAAHYALDGLSAYYKDTCLRLDPRDYEQYQLGRDQFGEEIDLLDLYVCPSVSLRGSHGKLLQAPPHRSFRRVLHGMSGIGKTSFLKALTLVCLKNHTLFRKASKFGQLCADMETQDIIARDARHFPLYFTAEQLKSNQYETFEALLQTLVCGYGQYDPGTVRAGIDNLLAQEPRLLVIIDSLDEIDSETTDEVAGKLNLFFRHYGSKTDLLCTSRPIKHHSKLTQMLDRGVWQLDELDKPRIAEMLFRLDYSAHLTRAREVRDRIQLLCDEVFFPDPYYVKLIGNPYMLLSIFYLTHDPKTNKERSQIISSAIEKLIKKRWEHRLQVVDYMTVF